MATHPVVLCAQDTAELDCNGQGIAGLGPPSDEAQRGLCIRPTRRRPSASRWACSMPGCGRAIWARRRRRLRAKHDHALPDGRRLWARALATTPLGELRFALLSVRGRGAREVRQEIHAQRASLSDRRQGELEVPARSPARSTPPGDKPIEGRLLSHRRADTLEAAVEPIDRYRARWDIDLLFLAPKAGCHVEALQPSTLERLAARARGVASGLHPARKPLPKQPPRLNEVLRPIARLDGFLGRKGPFYA